jgi:hypothetical protein
MHTRVKYELRASFFLAAIDAEADVENDDQDRVYERGRRHIQRLGDRYALQEGDPPDRRDHKPREFCSEQQEGRGRYVLSKKTYQPNPLV